MRVVVAIGVVVLSVLGAVHLRTRRRLAHLETAAGTLAPSSLALALIGMRVRSLTRAHAHSVERRRAA